MSSNIDVTGATTSTSESNGVKIVHVGFDSLMSDVTQRGTAEVHTMTAVAVTGSEERDEYTYQTPGAYCRILTGDKNAEKVGRNKFKRNRFIPMGIDNKYPHFLIELNKKSPTHLSALKTACNMAYGSGYRFLSEEDEGFAVGITEWALEIGFNSKFQKAGIRSIGTFGGAFVDLSFRNEEQKLNEDGTKPEASQRVKIKLGNFIERRLGKPNDDLKSDRYDEITYHWNNRLMWDTKRKTNPSGWKGIPVYVDENTRKAADKLITESGDPFYKDRPDLNTGFYSYLIGNEGDAGTYYPAPPFESSGALNAILLEEALSYFDLAGIQNGLSAGYIVTASLTDTSNKDAEEYNKKRDAIVEKIMDEVAGEDNNGQIVIMFQDPRDKAEAIKIAPIPHVNTSEMHKTLEERKRSTILTAWGVIDERIIGVPNITSKGQSSQSEALKTAEEIFYKLRIQPELIQPIEDFVEEILIPLYVDMEHAGDMTVIPSDFTHGFKRNSLFENSPSDAILLAVFGVNEIREMFGHGPASDEILAELVERKGAISNSTDSEGNPEDEHKDN